MNRPNPFAVHSPEKISAEAAVHLFVDVFTDFYNVPNEGHTFLHGPRGSGKTMMFRYLEPDCQMLAGNCKLADLVFFGVYVPIKATDFRLAELQRLSQKHAEAVLNEHLLVLHSTTHLINALSKSVTDNNAEEVEHSLREFYADPFKLLLLRSGWQSKDIPTHKALSKVPILKTIGRLLSDAQSTLLRYLRSLALEGNPIPYDGPLCGYLDFLLPTVQALKSLPFMPRGPVYLLIDDADNLSSPQTKILNSWVACRTNADISLKISTQLNYKTYLTSNGQSIRAPHDFSQVSIADAYTSNKSGYAQRVSAIVSRRLESCGIQKSPEEFFPVYEKQERAIEQLADDLRLNWESSGRGFRARDDATRYARPNYIKSLSGVKKSSSKYQYAGFQQLIDISSGIIRYFLDSASLMYGDMLAKAGASEVTAIFPAVQDQVVRNQAEQFLFSEVQPETTDDANESEALSPLQKLRNLIQALGGTFYQILISDASERRVFSIALSDEPDPEVRATLRLGVEYGFFHRTTIGNKEGTGRTRLYIMSRRLAPYFKLDPTSFAGYKFVKSEKLREAIYKPSTFVGRVKSLGASSYFDDAQMRMFEEE